MYKIRDLESYFPQVYLNSYVKEVLRCCQIEIEQLFDDLILAEKEYFISSATYSLPWWSNLAGIDYDKNVDTETSRSNILARIRANGITTVDVIKRIAESYSNGKCEVIENFGDYSFVVRFVSTVGIPNRIDEIKKIIDKVKPAHLNYKFDFKYRTWDEILKLGKTWSYFEEKGYTWDDLKGRGDL